MTDLERKEHRQEYLRDYSATHREEAKARSHKAYVANREEILAHNAAWKKEHPEYGAESRARNVEHMRTWAAANYQEHGEEIRARNALWNKAHPDLGRARHARFCKAHPEKVAAIQKKHDAKGRTLGFIPLNQPFEGCNGHHVDRERVVYIPEVLHMSIRHNVWNGRNMDKINAAAFDYLSKQEVAQ